MSTKHKGVNMRLISAVFFVVTVLVGSLGCDSVESDEYESEEYYFVDLSQVPEIVLDAARKAVPGLVIQRVKRERSHRGTMYEVYGVANGRYYEIEIGSDGTVYEIEIEDDDD